MLIVPLGFEMKCRKKEKLIFLLIYSSLIFAVWADESGKTIVGKWKTDVILSQVGRIVEWREFKADGTFHSKLEYFDMELPDDEISGTYEILGDKLTTVSKVKTHTSRFYFDDEDLIIDDGGGEVFRFMKIHQQPDNGTKSKEPETPKNRPEATNEQMNQLSLLMITAAKGINIGCGDNNGDRSTCDRISGGLSVWIR